MQIGLKEVGDLSMFFSIAVQYMPSEPSKDP